MPASPSRPLAAPLCLDELGPHPITAWAETPAADDLDGPRVAGQQHDSHSLAREKLLAVKEADAPLGKVDNVETVPCRAARHGSKRLLILQRRREFGSPETDSLVLATFVRASRRGTSPLEIGLDLGRYLDATRKRGYHFP